MSKLVSDEEYLQIVLERHKLTAYETGPQMDTYIAYKCKCGTLNSAAAKDAYPEHLARVILKEFPNGFEKE